MNVDSNVAVIMKRRKNERQDVKGGEMCKKAGCKGKV